MVVWNEVVGAVMAVLAPAAPFLMQAAESAASQIGEDAWQKAKSLYLKLRDRFNADDNQAAVQTLDLFVHDTETFEIALSKLLLKTLQEHPEWAKEVRELLADPSTQEIIARNESVLTRVSQSMSGGGKHTMRIEADKSHLTDIWQVKN